MNDELSFPNPVPRNDLPVRRKKRWVLRVLVALVVASVLGGVFLPQILSNRIGKRIVQAYIAGKCIPGVKVEIGDFSTHWFGPTSVRQIWLTSPDGKPMGCVHIECEAGLARLLRGKFELGKTIIDKAVIHYVSDYGDGSNLISHLFPSAPPPPPGETAVAAAAPRFSANIIFTNSEVDLFRGYVEPKLLSKEFHSVRFFGVNGKVDITALDKPFTYEADAQVIPLNIEAVEKLGPVLQGTVHLSGTTDLGDWAKPLAAARKYDLEFTGKDLQPMVLGPVFYPSASARDFLDSFGPTLNAVKAVLVTRNGSVEFDQLQIVGGKVKCEILPVIHLASVPRTFDIGTATADGGDPATNGNSTAPAPAAVSTALPAHNVITLAPSTALCRDYLAYVNPFFRDAAPGVGTVTLWVDSLSVPLDLPRSLSMIGRVEAHGLRLLLPTVASNSAPRDLTSAAAVWTGAFDQPPTLDVPLSRFSVGGGQVHVEPSNLTVGPLALTLAGTSTLDLRGTLDMTLALNNGPAAASALFAAVPGLESLAAKGGSASAALVVPLVGSVNKPALDLDAEASAMPVALGRSFMRATARQAEALRARELDAAMHDRTSTADDVLQNHPTGLKAWNMADSLGREKEREGPTTKPKE